MYITYVYVYVYVKNLKSPWHLFTIWMHLECTTGQQIWYLSRPLHALERFQSDLSSCIHILCYVSIYVSMYVSMPVVSMSYRCYLSVMPLGYVALHVVYRLREASWRSSSTPRQCSWWTSWATTKRRKETPWSRRNGRCRHIHVYMHAYIFFFMWFVVYIVLMSIYSLSVYTLQYATARWLEVYFYSSWWDRRKQAEWGRIPDCMMTLFTMTTLSNWSKSVQRVAIYPSLETPLGTATIYIYIWYWYSS